MPSATDSDDSRATIYRWLWRWHGYAGLFVIPFIFFMALTGLPYVWEHELEDLFHPEYRALVPRSSRVPYQQQLDTARAVLPERPLKLVIFDADPRHATQFQFGTSTDPWSVFVNPYDGKVITTICEWTRLSSAGIMLHGLTFIEPYGSWMLELLACWGIVLCATGVYLWWPRSPEKVPGVFLPRLRSGGRTRWRDLHAVTGFYLAIVLALYFATGLPWTAFWGGKLLGSIQSATGQIYPAVMTSDSGLEATPPSPDAQPLSLDSFVEFGLKQNLPGHLEIELPATRTGTVHLRNRDPEEKHFQLDPFTARPLGMAEWKDLPFSHQAVALGVDLHEGALFGRVTQILSTTLACLFMLIAAAGALTWWKRRPQGRLDTPRFVVAPPLPFALRAVLITAGLLMPLAGLTFLLFAARQKLVRA